jgi:two-component system CheB/CheR fusion protein
MEEILNSEGEQSKERPKSFPIVAIGASAGGLNAVTELLENLPANTGMAYIYVQHLDPRHDSNLVSILEKVTSMKVFEVQNEFPIEENNLYIIPPNKQMQLVDGVVRLTERGHDTVKYDPIDHFFISLAEKQKEGSIGILLSGADTDGTIGLKAIKAEGGLTFAQNSTAEFETMPRSALDDGAVDVVLSPREIAQELVRLSHNSKILKSVLKKDQPADVNSSADESDTADIGDIGNLLQLLKKNTGVDFTSYKQTTIRRRIMRRMLLFKLNNLTDYVKYIKKNTHEIGLLYQDLLINVTRFFRDEEAFSYLENEVFPKISKHHSPTNPYRIWVSACSTGEEPYSIVMLLMEVLGEDFVTSSVQVFASDLSEMAIAKARAGIYSASDVAPLSKQRLKQYFTQTDGHFRILKSIRDVCIFAPHNIIKDPPFSRVDLISCCNLLIYLELNLQKHILKNFHYSLNANGILVLGKSETVAASADLFSQLDKIVKVYAKKNESIQRPSFDVVINNREGEKIDKPVLRSRAAPEITTLTSIEKAVDSVVLNNYAPAGVVVNYDLDIIQFRGSTGLYLEHSPGKANFNLLKMARIGLQLDLKNAANKAIKTGVVVKKTGIEIEYKGSIHHVNFTVNPLHRQTNQKLLLILFEEMRIASTDEIKASTSKDRRVKQLEAELQALHEDVRSIVEAQETANEELQSANEEIVSSNEELQSINEELETSKEELESTNEELMTINQELQIRNEQLSEEQRYSEAIITTIREAILILDGSLRVKRANEVFYTMFKLKEGEIEGKLIYELANRQWAIPKLEELLEVVIPAHDHYNGFEIKHTFDGIGEKVMLLNARRVTQRVQGQQFILLAIEDITEHRHAEKLLLEREAWLRNMANSVPIMIWVAGADKNFTFLNKTWLHFTGRTLIQETGLGWTEGVHPDDVQMVLSRFHTSFTSKEPFSIEYRMKRKDGNYRWVLNSAVPTYESNEEFAGFTGSCIEIHDQKLMNDELERKVIERTAKLQEVNADLERSNNELSQFAYIASHDLQEPLRKIITFSTRLRERYEEALPAPAQEFLIKIGHSSDRMRQLIDDLLNFSRISRFEKKFVRTDLNKVLKEVLTDFDLLIQEKNALIHADTLPVITAIPLQINQLFYNLIHNGLKFSKANVRPKITISCRKLSEAEADKNARLAAGPNYFEIKFTDNGIGFQQEFATQIFEIFQRLNEKDEYPGTGIGLALCDKIVSNHRGVIFARGEENQGATFCIIVPEHQ